MITPDKIWLYRITHIENLRHILTHGLVTAQSANRDPNFIQIGDGSMINYRKELNAPIPPGGKFTEYIPFYFGPRSPMLLQIASGWEVQKVHQQEIVYIISSFDKIKEHNLPFFFSDGNARSDTSEKFNDENSFSELAWDAIYAKKWKSDGNDLRRQMKKQSEFLVKNHVPVSCFESIGVFNNLACEKVVALLKELELNLEVKVSPQTLYYDHL